MELLANITKKSNKKFIKARLGTKAAKNYEKLENAAAGDVLDEEASTMFRALSARYLYLAMDRPECAFSAKELCRQFSAPTVKGVEALKGQCVSLLVYQGLYTTSSTNHMSRTLRFMSIQTSQDAIPPVVQRREGSP